MNIEAHVLVQIKPDQSHESRPLIPATLIDKNNNFFHKKCIDILFNQITSISWIPQPI